jgi:hypothetical protein
MASIHLIDYNRDVRPLNLATREYESSDWVLSEAHRQALLTGGRIFLHDKQREPSFFGGTITAIHEVPVAEGQSRRWAIRFTADEQSKGVYAGPGWKQEQKFVA